MFSLLIILRYHKLKVVQLSCKQHSCQVSSSQFSHLGGAVCSNTVTAYREVWSKFNVCPL